MPKLDEKLDSDYQHDPFSNPEARKLIQQENGDIPGYDRAGDGLDDHPDFKNPNGEKVEGYDRSADGLDKLEKNWDTNVTGNSNLNQPKLQKALGFAKKRGGIIGLISLFGVGGGLLAGFFGPASMLISVVENMNLTNDASTSAMESRYFKVFSFMTNPDNDPICANSSKNIKCKMGRISNKALNKLSKKGIVAADYNGKKTGYPSRNPRSYTIDMGNGQSTKVNARELPRFLADNPKIASKVLGRSGAFNLRVKAWAGKHIANKFYNKFGIERKGGIAADESTHRGTIAERVTNAMKSVSDKMPDDQSVESAATDVTDKVTKRLNKAKRGGTAYLAAVSSCIVPKVPRYVAGAVAAIQVTQVIVNFNEKVNSPGSFLKAANYSNPNSDGIGTAGTLLTEQTPNDDGELTSAMDSDIMLASMGINEGKPAVSKDVTPAYAALNHPAVNGTVAKVGNDYADSASCAATLSKEAMYTAMITDAAVTVAASATIVGGLAKIAASWAASEIATAIVSELVENFAIGVLVELAQSDAIPEARGEKLGDALGIGAAAFYSAGGMARYLPTLKQSELASYTQTQKENAEFQKQMDIASLSPFDTSSRYTFLGSLMYKMKFSALENSSYTSPAATIMNLFRMPSLALSSTAGAAPNFTAQSCGYAEDFKIDSDVGINVAGLPCVGLTSGQAGVSTESAINSMINEGWIVDGEEAEESTIEDGDTIDDLADKKYIKSDNPMSDFIADCSDASTGDYLFNSENCTLAGQGTGQTGTGANPCYTADDGSQVCADSARDADYDTAQRAKNDQSVSNITPFLIDYQIVQAVNGEDDENLVEAATTDTNTRVASINILRDTMYSETEKICGDRSVANCTNYRMTNAAKFASTQAIDIFGVQELRPPMYPVLMNKLGSNYSSYPASYGNGSERSIFYNNQKWEAVGGGTIQYPWYQGPSRFPVAQLRNKTTNQTVFVYNTHTVSSTYTPNSEVMGVTGYWAKRKKTAELIMADIKTRVTGDAKVIVTGDFNSNYTLKTGGRDKGASTRNDLPYCVLTAGTTLANTFDIYNSRTGKCPSSGGPIDHVYASGDSEVTSWKAVSGGLVADFSDHRSVIVTDITLSSSAAGAAEAAQ